MIVFGRVTGIFAVHSFGGTCEQRQQYSMTPSGKNYTCPLGIDLNSFNYARFHK
jgi:hypothetical protein